MKNIAKINMKYSVKNKSVKQNNFISTESLKI